MRTGRRARPVVDDDAVVQELTEVLVASTEGLVLAGQVRDGGSALLWVREHQADVALLDFDLPDTTAEQLVPKLRAVEPGLPLLLHSGRHDVETWGARIGTDGAVAKSSDWAVVAGLLQRLGQQA